MSVCEPFVSASPIGKESTKTTRKTPSFLPLRQLQANRCFGSFEFTGVNAEPSAAWSGNMDQQGQCCKMGTLICRITIGRKISRVDVKLTLDNYNIDVLIYS